MPLDLVIRRPGKDGVRGQFGRSVPWSETINPACPFARQPSSVFPTRRPEIDVSGIASRHSRVTLSTVGPAPCYEQRAGPSQYNCCSRGRNGYNKLASVRLLNSKIWVAGMQIERAWSDSFKASSNRGTQRRRSQNNCTGDTHHLLPSTKSPVRRIVGPR